MLNRWTCTKLPFPLNASFQLGNGHSNAQKWPFFEAHAIGGGVLPWSDPSFIHFNPRRPAMVNGITSAGYAQTVSFTQPNISQSRPDASSPSEYKTGTDTVNISDQARFSLLSSLFSCAESNSISIRDIEESLSKATVSVEKRLQSLYRQIGISDSSQMEISVGYDGSILVKGENPESDALAEAINADGELANTIRGISANASLLEALKKHQEFAAAYEKDPVAAVERYGYLLEDGHEYNVSFSLQNGHIDTKVE